MNHPDYLKNPAQEITNNQKNHFKPALKDPFIQTHRIMPTNDNHHITAATRITELKTMIGEGK